LSAQFRRAQLPELSASKKQTTKHETPRHITRARVRGDPHHRLCLLWQMHREETRLRHAMLR
jgi:hypothetical protein